MADTTLKSHIDRVHSEVARHLAELSAMFQPGCLVTFIMRNPEVPGAMVVTDEVDLQEIIDAISTAWKPGMAPRYITTPVPSEDA